MRLVSMMILAVLFFGCGAPSPRQPVASDAPRVMLWAWERSEDLRFIDTRTTGVAYLAQTLLLDGGEVRLVPRRQPMELADGTYLIAVTRIESVRSQDKRPSYSDEQKKQAAELILKTLERPGVRGVQIDFDAAVSERDFYRELVAAVRAGLPDGRSLTMTALASWCVGETWLNTMNVDEAVPMAFEMGADTERVRSYIRSGQDWTVPLCRASYGFSVDEPGIEGTKPERRIYLFSEKSWRPEMVR